ncbi:hypothetical protein [Sphingobacterium sp. JUb56]|uniref:hypothetical protein n=1 Tax=Sphingobacterium sp. JUb56 TaxID=2587145 RepID=UPI0016123FF0|nr:hypothetical protein [Sphingobacterium sp. JUb56]MBB2950947.1 hypothetical protein [Sphingobacterium sp. JUb56]
MVRKICLLLLTSCLLISCSDKELGSLVDEIDVEHPTGEEEKVPIRIVADKNNQNFYEMVMFELKDSTYNGPNGSMLIPLKYQNLDSLTWEVEGSPKKLDLVVKQSEGYRFTTAWGHYFYLPGNYKTYLRGYRGKDLVVKDSATIRISGDGDFLHVKWSELSGDPNENIGYTNNGTQDYEFQVYSNKIGKEIFSKLNVRFEHLDYRKFNPEIGKRELEVFTTYISSLYGEPKYDETTKGIHAKFKKLFRKGVRAEQVIKIWLGKTSNMALLKKESWKEDGFGYEIHAEPNH